MALTQAWAPLQALEKTCTLWQDVDGLMVCSLLPFDAASVKMRSDQIRTTIIYIIINAQVWIYIFIFTNKG